MFPESPHESGINRLRSEVHVPPRSITCTARTLSPFLTFTNDLAEQTASWKHKEKHQMAARRKTDEAPKSIRRRSCIRGHNPHPFFSSIVRRPKSPVGCASSLHVMNSRIALQSDCPGSSATKQDVQFTQCSGDFGALSMAKARRAANRRKNPPVTRQTRGRLPLSSPPQLSLFCSQKRMRAEGQVENARKSRWGNVALFGTHAAF